MPHGAGGPSRCGEAVHCRCHTCEYELELEEGEKCEAVRCPSCGRPLYATSTGIAQQKAPRGPGRRDEDEPKIVIPPVWPPWEPKPPLLTTKTCRCPYCSYEIVVEEGARCLNSVCPRCGYTMVEVE